MMERLIAKLSKMKKFPADLLFSIANEAISVLNTNAVNNDRHPFVSANLDCALKDLRDAESDWNSIFHPLDMDEEDRMAQGEYLGDLEREGETR
jgi:hypothetical protein